MKACGVVFGACLASTLIFSSAFAASDATALPAGKPAGVKQAQLGDTIIPLVLAGALIGGIAILSSEQGQVATPATTSTSP
ncbi:MAG TPA: hypothetical protein VEM35_11490 [Rhizomicrobium sp.]|nr:hypothetical protein [Rhizomicrobium sp.]